MEFAMNDHWWPSHLSHIPKEDPWEHTHITVAEIKSIDEKPHTGQRTTFSALVPIGELDEVTGALAKLECDVSASGPHPSFFRGSIYEPHFWIGASDLPSDRYEPLVLSWSSHDKTVLQLDPKFLMTYGLSSRGANEGMLFWDDPAGPVHDVVKITGPSVWAFPRATTAFVSIRREYLQDYLSLRNMALIQVFWEQRWGQTDVVMEKELGSRESAEIKFPDCVFQIHRYIENRNIVATQVWGGRLIAVPGPLPITEDTLESEGLIWPGFSKAVTKGMARSMKMSDHIYVDDSVLGDFEGRPGFAIQPERGSVSFGTQWSVGYCYRIGRNLIRMELKKLYEGAPPHVVRHWNKFAVPRIPDAAYPAILRERNIAIRAKEVTFALADLGEELADLAGVAGLNDVRVEDFVGLRKGALEYHGWWSFPDTEVIARHVPLNCSRDAFLDRCVSLSKLVVEGLVESKLRKVLRALGVPSEAIADFGSLKLLDCILRLAQVSNATGLALSKEGPRVWDRLTRDGTKPAQPVAHLFAIYDLRLIKAHKSTDIGTRVTEELQRFGIAPGEEATGFGPILDRIYEALSAQLADATATVKRAVEH